MSHTQRPNTAEVISEVKTCQKTAQPQEYFSSERVQKMFRRKISRTEGECASKLHLKELKICNLLMDNFLDEARHTDVILPSSDLRFTSTDLADSFLADVPLFSESICLFFHPHVVSSHQFLFCNNGALWRLRQASHPSLVRLNLFKFSSFSTFSAFHSPFSTGHSHMVRPQIVKAAGCPCPPSLPASGPPLPKPNPCVSEPGEVSFLSL